VVPGGDRCTGGLTDATIVGGDAVEVEANVTPVDLVAGIDPDAPERVTGELDFCAVCCIGTVRHRFTLAGKPSASPVPTTLVSATLTEIADDGEGQSDAKKCAYGLMRRAAPTLPATLPAAAATKLVADIVATCGKKP